MCALLVAVLYFVWFVLDGAHAAEATLSGALPASFSSSRPTTQQGMSARPMTQQSMVSYRSIDSEDEFNRVLDSQFIIDACGVDTAEDISTARLQHCGLVDCVDEDMAAFVNLAHLDVSGNAITFDSLSLLPRLEVLEMALSGLQWIDPRGGFQALSILDLSFNKIAPDAILNLGRLPNLRSLDLSNNDLHELPLSMAASDVATFEDLETLMLNDNHLTSPGVFQALAGLPALAMLDLNNNKIEFVPHLVPSAAESAAYDVHAVQPFQMLQMLSLAENSIAKADDIITVANWENLQALHLWGNPLSTQRSSLPRSLAKELGKRSNRQQPGLVVSRKAPSQARPNVAGMLQPDAFVKVAPAVIPPIERGTSLRRYEEDKAKRKYIQYTTVRGAATSGPLSPTPVLPPITPHEDAMPAIDSEDEDDTPESGFFLTQVDESALSKSKAQTTTGNVLLETQDFDTVAADALPPARPTSTAERTTVAPPEVRSASRALALSRTLQNTTLEDDGAATSIANPDRQLALVPPGVPEKFSVLFREDTEEEKVCVFWDANTENSSNNTVSRWRLARALVRTLCCSLMILLIGVVLPRYVQSWKLPRKYAVPATSSKVLSARVSCLPLFLILVHFFLFCSCWPNQRNRFQQQLARRTTPCALYCSTR